MEVELALTKQSRIYFLHISRVVILKMKRGNALENGETPALIAFVLTLLHIQRYNMWQKVVNSIPTRSHPITPLHNSL